MLHWPCQMGPAGASGVAWWRGKFLVGQAARGSVNTVQRYKLAGGGWKLDEHAYLAVMVV